MGKTNKCVNVLHFIIKRLQKLCSLTQQMVGNGFAYNFAVNLHIFVYSVP